MEDLCFSTKRSSGININYSIFIAYIPLYALAAWSMAAYMGYKIYSRSVWSSDFTDSLKEGEISKVIILGLTVIFKKNNSDKWFITERSLYNDDKLLNILEASNAKFSWSPISDTSPIIVLVNIVLPTYLMIWALKKFIMPDTDNPIKPNIVSNYVWFSDIGGNDHAKDQLLEIADYIKNPEKYQKLGIRLPRGILLYGPPGTGKTLMARALSWEWGIPIKYACGSDFVELYAGLGPKRIRSLFETARGLGKCIIFIDELDSLGGERGKGNACKEFDTLH